MMNGGRRGLRTAVGARSRVRGRRFCGEGDAARRVPVAAEYEASVRRHRDFSMPILLITGGLATAYLLQDLYDRLTRTDVTGKSTMDFLIFHKRDQILPDKQPERTKCPTLLLDVNDCLLAVRYREGSKYAQTIKRPGLDLFLKSLSQHYEIVIYTLSDLNYTQDIHARLDLKHEHISNYITRELIKRIDTGEWPYGVIPSVLAPRYKKNLHDVGRRLERVVHLDSDPESFYDDESQDDNRIVIPRYSGDADDRELVHLIPFFEFLADEKKAPFDLRRAIRFYKDKMTTYETDNIGLAYLYHQEEKKRAKAPAAQSGGGFLGRLGLA
eukprot:Hpha_TRINITY_DN34173_c0_g1::TRINITY_DN34173_c0_g1_i1::g.75733::m.75733/K17496/TIM50; mitochondrial import inner membrane translocase subunit TIM50